MKRILEIQVSARGEIRIDAAAFRGADCEHATRFLEQALGQLAARQKKPEYHQRQHTQQRQRLGG